MTAFKYSPAVDLSHLDVLEEERGKIFCNRTFAKTNFLTQVDFSLWVFAFARDENFRIEVFRYYESFFQLELLWFHQKNHPGQRMLLLVLYFLHCFCI